MGPGNDRLGPSLHGHGGFMTLNDSHGFGVARYEGLGKPIDHISDFLTAGKAKEN